MYRLFYLDWKMNDGEEYFVMSQKVINKLKDAEKHNIYYLTDLNGDVIIDNRKEIKKKGWIVV